MENTQLLRIHFVPSVVFLSVPSVALLFDSFHIHGPYRNTTKHIDAFEKFKY